MTPLRDLLNEKQIHLDSYREGNYKRLCPVCSHTRKKKSDPCLSITIEPGSEAATWFCHNFGCGFKGGVRESDNRGHRPRQQSRLAARPTLKERHGGLSAKAITFFARRKIGHGVLKRNGVTETRAFMPQVSKEVDVLAFPYTRGGELINVKYRGANKIFRQEKGAEKIVYGYDDVVGQDEIIIVEGELDKLALEEAGILNVCSVPDGAPASVAENVPPEEEDRKFDFIWNCRELWDKASRILIATDADEPGDALAEELARRLDKARCWRVRWPAINDDPMKDANQVLIECGPQVLKECVANPVPYPISGLGRFGETWERIMAYYQHGLERGLSTGWKSLDGHYHVLPGDVTVVTGAPGSGKSEWVDALAVNLAMEHGWVIATCSMENTAEEHFAKIAEKYLGVPFFEAEYAVGIPRMGEGELDAARDWIDQHFVRIECEGDQLPTFGWILDVARSAVMRHGIRGLVIDPYTELDHQRPEGMPETEYVSTMLSKVRHFARTNGVHVWFVAHPRQLKDWNGAAPGLYDISGSAHWANKPDVGVVISRNRDPQVGSLDEVEIILRKVRRKIVGQIGSVTLRYDRVTGRYHDLTAPEPEPRQQPLRYGHD